MAEPYSWETREQAQELYVIEGHTYDEVAGMTGVSVSQLKRWGKEDSWSEAKRELRQALTDIKRKRVLLRRDLLDKAMGLEPQNVYAFAKMEQVAAAIDKGQEKEPKPAPVPISERKFGNYGEAIDALQQAIFLRFGELVQGNGSINPKAISDLKTAMVMVDEMKAKYSPEEESDAYGLDDEDIEYISERCKL